MQFTGCTAFWIQQRRRNYWAESICFYNPGRPKQAIENEHDIIRAGKTRNVEYSLIKRDKTKFSAEINTSIVFEF